MKVIVNNIATEYSIEGEGPALLFLHGWQQSLQNFNGLAEQLKDQFKIVRIDLPGFGGSEPPSKPWTVGDYGQFVRDFITKLNLQPDALVGHSFGGRIILKGISDGYLNPAKIVLIGAAGIAAPKTPQGIFLNVMAKIARVALMFPGLSHHRQQIRKRVYQKLGSDYATSGGLKDTYLNVVREDLSENAAKIQTPTLLIWGKQDVMTPLSDGERLNRLIVNSRLVVIDHADHFVHNQKPEEVAKLMREFL